MRLVIGVPIFAFLMVGIPLPLVSGAQSENLIGNGTFGAALWGWTYDVSPSSDALSEANISYDAAKGINSPDGAARAHLFAEKDVLFMPWLGVQFRVPGNVGRVEVSAWHRVETYVANDSESSGFELLKLEDLNGNILVSEREKAPHADLTPTALSMKISGSLLRPGDQYNIKLFSMVTLNATQGSPAEYTVFWDDVSVIAVFQEFPVLLVGAGAAAGLASALVVVFLLRRRRRARAENVRIDDVFLLYNDGRLVKHYPRAARPSFDSETFASMLKALELFVVDTLGKGQGGELQGLEFSGQKIRFVKGRYVTLAAVVTGEDERGAIARARHTLETMEKEHSGALESWSGKSEDVAFASAYVEKLLAGGF